MPRVFRPVRWRVFGTAALLGFGVAVLALTWPGLMAAWRVVGLLLAGLFAVSFAAPVAEQVEVDADRVSVRTLLRAPRQFAGPGATWTLAHVPIGRRQRKSFDVLTLHGPDGRDADVLLKYYRPERKQELLAAVGEVLARRE